MIANPFQRGETVLFAKTALKSAPSSASWRHITGHGLMVLIYGILLVSTTSDYLGDTGAYASNIVQYDRDGATASPDLLWDAGHLYWRPLGLVLYKLFAGLTHYGRTGEHELAAIAILIAVTMVCGLVCALLFYDLAFRLTKRRWTAILVATSFISFYAFLNYVHAGSSYVPGLTGALLGLRFAIVAAERGRNPGTYSFLSGLFVGLAALLWLPYVLVLPGILAASVLWDGQGAKLLLRDKLRIAFYISGSTAFVVTVGYFFAILQLHIFSIATLQQWFLAAGHGSSQSKRLLRLATGLPRSFIHLGNGGLLLKRFVLHDPYAHTSLIYLIEHYVLKLIFFYVAAVVLVRSLLRSGTGRRLFYILLAGVFPALLFAVAVFEPGSSERYLPIYPFVCLAISYVLATFPRNASTAVVIFTFVFLAISTNVYALWRPTVESRNAATISRIESLQGRVAPQGLVALVTLNDGIYQFSISFPFEPINRGARLPIYDVIQVANSRILRWKQEFAQRALASLGRSAAVWVSTRLLAEQPDPGWDWIEGDDSRIAWRDLPIFFRQFSYSDSVGAADGFLRLAPSRENVERLNAIHER